MANVRIVLNRQGVREMLQSRRVLADMERRARAIADAAGPGHVVDSEIGRNRARASVRTATFEAMHAESTDHTLTRAIDAGRH